LKNFQPVPAPVSGACCLFSGYFFAVMPQHMQRMRCVSIYVVTALMFVTLTTLIY